MEQTSGWDILASLATFGQFLVACWVGWYGYRKYLSDENIEASDERIEIFSTAKQSTELRVSDRGLECHIHDIRDGRGGHQWTLTKDQATPVQVTTDATSSKSGKVRIGPRHGWLYSHKLWPDPKVLEQRINELIDSIGA